MKLIVGSDERTHMTDALVEELRKRGHDIELVGPLADTPLQWPEVGRQWAKP